MAGRRALTVSLTVAGLAFMAAQAAAQPLERPPRLQGFRSVDPVETDVEAEIVDRTNAFRVEHAQGRLKENAVLTGEARDFAAYLAQKGSLSHTADGRTSPERARAAGYDYCEVAENLAFEQDVRDFRDVNLAEGLVNGWENSPGHRRNMLNEQVTEIGVGVARAPGGAPKYVAVQVFGRPAALRVTFQVTNRTQFPVSYAFAGRTRRIWPGATITHSACSAGPLVFNTRGSAGKAPYPVEPGGLYILQPDATRGARVEIMKRGA